MISGRKRIPGREDVHGPVVEQLGLDALRFHIRKQESCKRRARARSPARLSTAGRKAWSAPNSVAVRLPVSMSTCPYQSPVGRSSAR